MEQTAQSRGQIPQQIPAQQYPNIGMMPGSNPIELLQMQQMQQMQQMFQNMTPPKWAHQFTFCIAAYINFIYWFEKILYNQRFNKPFKN